jgi:hypothetical protein
MISAMGNAEGEAKSGFVLLDDEFKVGFVFKASYPSRSSHRI